MNKLTTGDTVRFLNSVGGGIVKGFLNRHVAIVEDEHGFDVPVLVAECVVVKTAGSEKPTGSEKQGSHDWPTGYEKMADGDWPAGSERQASHDWPAGYDKMAGSNWPAGYKKTSGSKRPTELPEKENIAHGKTHSASISGTATDHREEKVKEEQPEETPEGEKITACLAWLPLDIKNLSSTAYECYFVNDSNYYLFFNYMSGKGDSLKIRHNRLIEPNSKIFLEEIEKSNLSEIETVTVQFLAFKRHKPFGIKNPCSVELHINTVKFYKLHSFKEDDYFEEDALICFLMRNDIPEKEFLVSAEELEYAMKEKTRQDNKPQKELVERKREEIKRKETNGAGNKGLADKERGDNEIRDKGLKGKETIEKGLKDKEIEEREAKRGESKSRETKSEETKSEIDLHINELLDTTAGMNNADILEYQINKFKEVMDEHIHRKNHKIVFIHGKGDGVLRTSIIKELRKSYPKCYYQDASFREYGYGATMVIIK